MENMSLEKIKGRKDKLSLNGKWLLNYFEEEEGEKLGVYLSDYLPQGWLESQVPGDVHLDLLKAGRILDPFFGKNVEECTWMEEKDWWYRREFFAPSRFEDKKVKLVFEGLDTFATIWLNGKKIGEHQNMFTSYELEINDYLKTGERNVLAVKLASPLKAVAPKMEKTKKLRTNVQTQERLYARKSQMSYGWDIAPRLVTIGIWRSVWLIAQDRIAIEDIFVKPTKVTKDNGEIKLEITLQNYKKKKEKINLRVKAQCRESKVEREIMMDLSPGRGKTSLRLIISNPKLWQPWDMGKPNLYQLTAKVYTEGRLLDTYTTTFGLRKVELTQEEQSDGGKSFTFSLNGQKVFIRGINWTPADPIFSRISKEKYKKLIQLAKEANINMFRIWGGGIIEDKTFYQLCDEEGIMIWQDFMYACAEYPTDPEFLSLVEQEGERIVRQLRNHPSLVLWCGDNESEAIYGYLHPIQKEILKKVCARLDPTRPYWPSSPHGGGKANDPYQGDTHNYHHGTFYKSDFYSKDESRFVSEIGHLSIPKLSTLRSFLPPGSIWPPESEYWSYHTGTIKYADPARLIRLREAIASCGFGYPRSVEDLIRITQLIQAMACRYWIEHYRQRKFLCSGILIWNMSDAWPQISDAITDYFLNPKVAYFYIRRAYTPILISFKEKESKDIELCLINDTLRSIRGKVQLKHLDFTGEILKSQELDIQAEANSVKKIKKINLEELTLQEKRKECLYACFFDEGGKMTENTYFFVKASELCFPDAALVLSLESSEETKEDIVWKIKISTDNYARLLELTSLDSSVEFSDNYFDLLPKEERIIKAIIKKPKNEGEMYPRVMQAEAWNSKKISSTFSLPEQMGL